MKKPDGWLSQSPEETAKTIIEQNISIETYESVIKRREGRLKFWLENNQEFIANQERELIEHGKETLAILKSLENKTNKHN